MPITSSRAHRTTAAPRSTRTTRSTAHPGLKSKLLGGGTNRRTATKRNPATGTTTTTTTTTKTTRTTGGHHATAAPVHHHKRHATVGDKVSGALTKLKGTLTGRPGVKVCSNIISQLPTSANKHSRLLALAACMVPTDVTPVVFTRVAISDTDDIH